MNDKLVFDYYYGREAEQFSFYRIPRMLIKDEHFSSLSNDAKILYGLMLDRMSLSVRNGWQDDQDRTYIIYTIDAIMEDLNCCKTKAVKTLGELDVASGIGLVEKKRQGLGKPDIIYVKNFVGITIVPSPDEDIKNREDAYDYAMKDEQSETKTSANPQNSSEVHKMDFKKSTKWTSGSMPNGLQEVHKMDSRKSTEWTSSSMQSGLQEVCKMDSNYNNMNQTNLSYTENIQSNPINPAKMNVRENMVPEQMNRMEEINSALAYVRDIVGYDILKDTEIHGRKAYDMHMVDELLDVMVSAMTSKKPYLNIGGEDVPIQQVKSRFEKYNMQILEYVMNCLQNNTTKVINIRKYMLAALFNAPMTINMYYQAEVNHDMYGE